MSIIYDKESEYNFIINDNETEKFEKICTNNELEYKKNIYKKKYNKLKIENDDLTTQIISLNQQLEKKDSKYIRLEKLYHESIEECTKYKEMYNDLLVKLQTFENMNNEKSIVLRERYFTIMNLESKNTELETKIEKLEKFNSKLQKQIDELKSFYKHYKNICQQINNSNINSKNDIIKNIKDIYENKIDDTNIIKKDTIINDSIYREYFKNIDIKDNFIDNNITTCDSNENIITYENNYNNMYYNYFNGNI